MKKVLMIVTSHADLLKSDSKTGLWIGEFTDPYYEFKDKGYTVVIASPKGGHPPIDPMSELTENITASNKRFKKDDFAKHALMHTLILDDLEMKDYDALFYPGGHGPMFDLATNVMSGQLIIDCLAQGKPLGLICHGPAALIKAAEMDPSILRGKRVTGFSNMEEKLVFKSNNIPFLLEDKLVLLGGEYHKSLIPFTSHIEEDGWLITGQNPASAGPAAEALIKLLETQP